MTSSHFFFLFLIGNKSNIIDEKKERKIQGVHNDERRKAITEKKRNQEAILREEQY